MIYSEIPFAFQTRMRALSNGDMDAHPAIVFPDERVENPSKAKVDISAKHLIIQMLKVDPKGKDVRAVVVERQDKEVVNHHTN